MRRLVLAAIVLVASCQTSTAPADTVGDLRAVLDDTGCRLDGDTAPTPGSITVEVVNQTGERTVFELVAIGDGGTYAGLVTHVAAEADRLASGRTMAGPPAYLGTISRTELPAHTTATMTGDVRSGSHTIVCGRLGASLHVTAEIDVR